MTAEVSTIGILGGMGPEATNQLCALITRLTPVTKDQDHIPVISFNNSKIPSRVDAVKGKGESPAAEMIRTARVLEQAGADLLLIPCNLAHVYLEDTQREIDIPILDMIRATASFVTTNYPDCQKAGLIASTPTIDIGIYDQAFRRSRGPSLIWPDSDVQESMVMTAIYGSEGIKCGHKERPRVMLAGAVQTLVDRGAEVIIAGCTEVSLVLNQKTTSVAVIDPLEVVARLAIDMALRGEPKKLSQPAVASSRSL